MGNCTFTKTSTSDSQQIARFLADNEVTYGVPCFLAVYSMVVPTSTKPFEFTVVTVELETGEIVEDLAGCEMITVSTDRATAIDMMSSKCQEINDFEDEILGQ